MSLVKDLNISLKDFFPEEGAIVITSKNEPIAVVSARLNRALRDYAASSHLSLAELINQLRREMQK